MKAEILSVGTELLLGQIVNTDAQYLSRQLSQLGIDVYYHCVVGDNEARLLDALGLALSRSDLVITTGGLGPTQDDLTKETVAKYFGLALKEHTPSREALEAYFVRRRVTPNNFKQVYFPEGAQVLPNAKGTAPGCVVERDGKMVIILPGPPFELIDMVEKQVLPLLRSRQKDAIHSRFLRLFGIGESVCEHELSDLMQGSNPTVAPYAGFGEVMLRLTVKCGKDEDPAVYLDPLEAQIQSRVGEYIYAREDVPLHAAVARALLARSLTLGVAESCTGGKLAAVLIDTPGISACLKEGCVAYANEAKERTLGVSAQTLAQFGAVSRQTAIEMAQGIRARAQTDIGISTTGLAGPDGGTAEKPVGLVYIGIADKNGAQAFELRLNGDRTRVRDLAVLNALDLLRRHIGA